jgi:hypothetical protein
LRLRTNRDHWSRLYNMTFLHPWAILIGIVAAAGPLLIHWLTRPRPVRLPLSTLRFVREAVHQQRTWHRLRDFVLLCLRTLAVLLIALAVARPQWGQPAQVSDLQGSDAVRVVVLDVSQSMAARTGAVEQIERARTVAANYLRYRPGLVANLILAGARPQGVFDTPSTNFDALRDELARCRALPQRIDVNRSLDLAARMLAPSSENDHRRRELVVVSDFQRTAWAKANFSPLPADTHIQLESTAAAEPPVNLAILRVDGHSAGSQGSTQLDVEVGNYSPAARKITVEVALGNSTWRLSGTCPAGRRTTLSEEIGVRRPGWQTGEARLVGVDDALAADNVCPFVLLVRPQPTYVLMTRQTKGRRATSSLFLECALAPTARIGGKPNKQAPSVVRMDPASFDHATLAAGDLILLDHPGKLSDETVKLLAALLHRGRPLLYVASELADATNLKRLCEVAGSGLQMPVEFTPPPAGQVRRDLFLTSVRRDSPPFDVFGDNLTSTIGRLRFAGGLSSRRLDTGVDADVLAGYNDGSAGVVLCSSGAGVLAVINADLAASNLPKTSAFVPLMAELVEQMLNRRRATNSAICGEPLVAPLPTDAGMAAGLRIRGPDAAGDRSGKGDSPIFAETKIGTVPGAYGELVDEAAGAIWHWTNPGPPGVYRVERDGTTVFALAANIPAEESQLDALPPSVLTSRLARGPNVAYHGTVDESQQRDDFWKWFAVACVVCFLGEMSALLIFRT